MKIERQPFGAMPQFTIGSVDHARWEECDQTDPLHVDAWCYGLFDKAGELVAFNSVMRPPLASSLGVWGHRLVVLPAWRGKGIALAFDEWLGEQLRRRFLRYNTRCLHRGLAAKFEASVRWEKCGPEGVDRIYCYKPEVRQ